MAFSLPDQSGMADPQTMYSSLQGEHSRMERTGFLRMAKKDEAVLLEACNAFVQFLKNTPEGRRADTQPAEMDRPNPNWAPRPPSAHAGIRYWGNWETPRDAEGDTEDYDWQELSADSSKKLDQYQKVFKAQAKTKYPGLKFDIGGSEKNWLEISVS